MMLWCYQISLHVEWFLSLVKMDLAIVQKSGRMQVI